MNDILYSILQRTRQSIIISDAFTKADSVINHGGYKKILCSISGGADSDIMLDIVHSVDVDNKINYVWFDTGLEYKATKEHLNYLENRYDIIIRRERAIKPIPITVEEYGQPFLSKYVSEHMHRLQKAGFQWEDKTFEVLNERYPNLKSSLNWWCNNNNKIFFKNKNKENENKGTSAFDINRYLGLKEFIISNPPDFKISPECCNWSKKKTAKKLLSKENYDLDIMGIRKSEGGIRQYAYDNCYTINTEGVSHYRPLFWFTQSEKKLYEKLFNIRHSDCYYIYGFPRTGCSCCPYAGWNNLVKELSITRLYEPNLYKAVCNVFKESYEYTQAYMKFRNNFKHPGRMRLF